MYSEETDKYEVLHRIFDSGLGCVYAGRTRPTGVSVALKTQYRDKSAHPNEDLQSDLDREFRILSRLSHSNIVRVHERFTLNGNAWFAMENIEGGSFDEAIAISTRQAPERRFTDVMVSIFRQLQSALDHIHERGIVYWRLAPWKLLIRESGVLKLFDFEQCRVLGVDGPESPPVGNIAYFAPESFRETFLIESDYFSIGTLLYECLTGTNPFQIGGLTGMSRLFGFEVEPILAVIPEAHGDLRKIIARLWAQEPSARREGWEMLRAVTRNAPLVGLPPR